MHSKYILSQTDMLAYADILECISFYMRANIKLYFIPDLFISLHNHFRMWLFLHACLQQTLIPRNGELPLWIKEINALTNYDYGLYFQFFFAFLQPLMTISSSNLQLNLAPI